MGKMDYIIEKTKVFSMVTEAIKGFSRSTIRIELLQDILEALNINQEGKVSSIEVENLRKGLEFGISSEKTELERNKTITYLMLELTPTNTVNLKETMLLKARKKIISRCDEEDDKRFANLFLKSDTDIDESKYTEYLSKQSSIFDEYITSCACGENIIESKANVYDEFIKEKNKFKENSETIKNNIKENISNLIEMQIKLERNIKNKSNNIKQ